LFCPVAREIWSEVKKGYDVHLNRRGFTSPKTWLAEFLANNGATQATVLAVTFWHIWDARNKLREEGGSINPLSIALKIKAYVELILTHLYRPIPAHRCETSRTISWSPPPDGMLQLNVDAALFSSSGRMGAGVVARDDMGEFVACIGNSSPDVVCPELAEAMAIRLALSWARGEGLDNFIIASDCLSVVQRINSKDRDRSACGAVIADIKKLALNFSVCSFQHVNRVRNYVAHKLARASEFSCLSVWRGVPPDYIQVEICNDSVSG
jgi:ribonuclease HI